MKGFRRLSTSLRALVLVLVWGLSCAVVAFLPLHTAAQSVGPMEVAVALPLSGEGEVYGTSALEGIQLAIDEANEKSTGPDIKLSIYDDKTSDDEAQVIAKQIADSQAVMVLGPAYSTAAIAAGPTYAAADLAVLPPTATSDAITESPTTFRVVYKNSDQGRFLATYLMEVLGEDRATVITVDGVNGQTLRDGFQDYAKQLGIDAEYYTVSPAIDGETAPEIRKIASRIAARPESSPIVLMTFAPEGAQLIIELRRRGVEDPLLTIFGDREFSQRFVDLPEEQEQPGYFTNNLYGLSPFISDSANANTLAFIARYRSRFERDPAWMAVAGYDAAKLAVEAIYQVARNNRADLQANRAALVEYLISLDQPAKALPGLLGPYWYDQNRERQQRIRIGQFVNRTFQSAPLQIVPVTTPIADDLDSGVVFPYGDENYARLQRVVYTGLFLNEISQIDLAERSFYADFYLWLRFKSLFNPSLSDPTDLVFPSMISDDFTPEKPAEKLTMDDGTEYWLWQIQGEFLNDFDLRRYPFDNQTLSLSFFNARSPVEEIVYVTDQSNSDPPAIAREDLFSVATPETFRNLTQWDPLEVQARRGSLVTPSALGNPTRVGVERQRELSGFFATVDIQRRTLTTLVKTLLPLLLLTMIVYSTLHFTVTMLVPKIVATITLEQSGTVLLTSINNQLGGVGYTVVVEYVFYIFFALGLLNIVSVFTAERMRVNKRFDDALKIEQLTRIVFLITIGLTAFAMVPLYLTR